MLAPRLPRLLSWLHCQPLSGSALQPGGNVDGPGQKPLQSFGSWKSWKLTSTGGLDSILPSSSSRTATLTGNVSCNVVVVGSASLETCGNESIWIGIGFVVGYGGPHAHPIAPAIARKDAPD